MLGQITNGRVISYFLISSIILAPYRMPFINIDITDRNGIIKALPEVMLKINVEGAGSLQGFGSANCLRETPFNILQQQTYYGRTLAVIRSGVATGDIKVTISAEGLQDKIINFKVD